MNRRIFLIGTILSIAAASAFARTVRGTKSFWEDDEELVEVPLRLPKELAEEVEKDPAEAVLALIGVLRQMDEKFDEKYPMAAQQIQITRC